MGYIYCITNKLNNKKYVGQTKVSVETRFWQHIHKKPTEIHYKPVIYQAIQKHGVDNFFVETLEQCDDSVINEREMYWIYKLGTFKKGYNQTIGGEGGTTVTPQEKKRMEKLFLKHWDITEVSKTLKKEKSTIREHLNNMGYTTRDIQIYKKGLLLEKYAQVKYIFEQTQNVRETAKRMKMERRSIAVILKKAGFKNKTFKDMAGVNKKVIQIDSITNEQIEVFDSIKEAAKKIKRHPSTISHAIDKKNKVAGYIWETYKGA